MTDFSPLRVMVSPNYWDAKIGPRLDVDPDTGCWRWTGGIGSGGYGQVRVNGRLLLVHRVAYELFVGPTPEGLELDHLCRVTECANPEHLEAVTHAENQRRGRRGVLYEIPAECRHGHALVGDNLGPPHGTNRWLCRTCHSQNARRYRSNQNGKIQ